MNHITYKFTYLEKCQMCHSSSDNFKILGKRLNASQGRNPSRKIGMTTSVCKCKACGLIFANPLPVPLNIGDHYDVPPEDYWTEDYFKLNNNYVFGQKEWLLKSKGENRTLKALDVGAGIGKQMIYLERLGFDTYGIEPSLPFYERALSKMGIDKSKLDNVSIEEADYEPNSFDFINFGVVLEHLYFPSDSLSKAIGWLRKGGLIHIEVPSADWLINRILNNYYKLKGSDYVANISPMHPPYHLTEFSLKSFMLNAEINGYKVKDHTFFVCETYMPKILDPLLKRYMRRTNKGMQLSVWLEKI